MNFGDNILTKMFKNPNIKYGVLVWNEVWLAPSSKGPIDVYKLYNY